MFLQNNLERISREEATLMQERQEIREKMMKENKDVGQNEKIAIGYMTSFCFSD